MDTPVTYNVHYIYCLSQLKTDLLLRLYSELTDTYFPSTLYLQDLQPTWPEHHLLSCPGYLHLRGKKNKKAQNKSTKIYTTIHLNIHKNKSINKNISLFSSSHSEADDYLKTLLQHVIRILIT